VIGHVVASPARTGVHKSGKTSVIIPYYQGEPGILRGAVISAMSQKGVSDLEIIVVDDGSPAPARDDLNNLDLPAHVMLKLIEQPNRGPGAARNRALDSVSPDTVDVALLDSDDRWTPDHLGNARFALEKDCDFYFADAWMTQCEATRFSSQDMRSDHHVRMDPARGWYEFRLSPGRGFFDLTRFVHTSTVVYLYMNFAGLRFQEEFFIGEDLVFFLELAKKSRRIGFSKEVECVTGSGIHIWQDSGWDTPRAIWRLCHDIASRKCLEKHFLTSGEEIGENRRAISMIRQQFIANLLHELRNRRAFRNPDIFRFIKRDPAVLLYMGPAAVQEIIKKIGR
jgi:succinoglycan biosynthesis protein ExoW